MATTNVNPTRMELTRLKKRLVTARRGHKLLKDKRDELMRQFLEAVRENKRIRREVEAKLEVANQHMSIARSLMSNQAIAVAMMYHKQGMTLEVSEKNVMSVKVPVFKAQYTTADEGDIYSYGYSFTPIDLDDAIYALSDIMPDLISLAEIEKKCQLMASEIEKTRRRVNALEHVMIPDYEEKIRYITMKLDESERSATTRLMKVKDMMIEKTIRERQARNQELDAADAESSEV
ncbi:MAG: V-type ATP synthase subunit D [Clostridiales bacterium]|nr:V-type ATP synthase subunit D [Candidatus Scatonaster coprocaballi]